MAGRWVTTNVRLDPGDYADLQRVAAASGHSLAECIRIALGRSLAHPEPVARAAEAAAPYEGAAAEENPAAVPAVVSGRTLVLPSPLAGARDGEQVWIRRVGAAEVAERARHRRVVADLLREFEALEPGPPAPTGEDDRELYR